MRAATHGALAGAAAGAAWAAVEPLLKRVFGTPYADAEVVSAFVTRGRAQPLVSVAVHSANGAVFGSMFARFGGRGVRRGVAAAIVENAALWPFQIVVDRIHPNRRDGTWPPIAFNSHVFAQATAGHVLFGVVLGALGPR